MQDKEAKKCVAFGLAEMSCGVDLSSDEFPECIEASAQLDSIDYSVQFDTSNCPTVRLDTDGLIRVSDDCVYWYRRFDIFKV